MQGRTVQWYWPTFSLRFFFFHFEKVKNKRNLWIVVRIKSMGISVPQTNTYANHSNLSRGYVWIGCLMTTFKWGREWNQTAKRISKYKLFKHEPTNPVPEPNSVAISATRCHLCPAHPHLLPRKALGWRQEARNLLHVNNNNRSTSQIILKKNHI